MEWECWLKFNEIFCGLYFMKLVEFVREMVRVDSELNFKVNNNFFIVVVGIDVLIGNKLESSNICF